MHLQEHWILLQERHLRVDVGKDAPTGVATGPGAFDGQFSEPARFALAVSVTFLALCRCSVFRISLEYLQYNIQCVGPRHFHIGNIFRL